MVLRSDDWVGKAIAGGRYRILGQIGAGSMGHVFQAFDHNLLTEVVIKVPITAGQGMPLPDLLERFSRETRSLVQLSHPHIVKVIDVGSLDGSPYVVMQYLTGGSLKDRTRSGPSGETRPMPAASLRDWLMDVARALDFIHTQGHIHRDVKPANILFDAHGNAFLGDFGIIKSLSGDEDQAASSNSLTAPGFLLGTPNYVAPEIVMGGPPCGRSDQYSLALSVHEVVTGRNFIVGPSPSATLVNQTNLDPPALSELLPGISERLSRAVRRAMSKELDGRFPSCVAFAQEALADLPEPADQGPSFRREPLGSVPCPSCGAPVDSDARDSGEEVRCLRCGVVLRAIPQDPTVLMKRVGLKAEDHLDSTATPPAASHTGPSLADAPRADVPDLDIRSSNPSTDVSYADSSFAERPGRGHPGASVLPVPVPSGPPANTDQTGVLPEKSQDRRRFRAAMLVAGVGLFLALGAVAWPVLRGSWDERAGMTRRVAVGPWGSDGSPGSSPGPRGPVLAPPETAPVEIKIAYGTEKKNWLEAALREYRTTLEGRRSKVQLIPLGSLEGAKAVLDGPKPTPIHVWSPASSAYRTMFEQLWRTKHAGAPILQHQDLALTPMVFVMWKHRHEAFIRKYTKVTFHAVGEAMSEPTGWTAIADRPDWGLFKFTHTDPKKSNSGFLTLVLMAYEFRDKLRDIAPDDIQRSDFREWLAEFERRVSRPSGSLTASTGTLMEEMVNKGPSQYDCILLYENLAIDYMERARDRWGELGELQVVYPDPNIWNDHPYYILDVPWSSAAQRSAAREFLDFLMSEPIQRRALDHGFRPGSSHIAVNTAESPLIKYKGNGLRIAVPRICEPPRSEVVTSLLSTYDRAERGK